MAGAQRRCTISTRTFRSLRFTPRWLTISITSRNSMRRSKKVCARRRGSQRKQLTRHFGSGCGGSASCREHRALHGRSCAGSNYTRPSAPERRCETAQEDGTAQLEDALLLDRATALKRVLFTRDEDLLVEATAR